MQVWQGVREIPIRNGIDVYDWWSVKRPENESCRVAWKNLNGRGFTVMERVHPEAFVREQRHRGIFPFPQKKSPAGKLAPSRGSFLLGNFDGHVFD